MSQREAPSTLAAETTTARFEAYQFFGLDYQARGPENRLTDNALMRTWVLLAARR
jgi:hypothetical protein